MGSKVADFLVNFKRKNKFLFFRLPAQLFCHKVRAGFAFLLLILFFIVVFAPHSETEKGVVAVRNLTAGISLTGIQDNGDLFLQPDISQKEYPDLSLIQDNSLIGFSSPLLIESQALAMMTQAELDAPKEIIEYKAQPGDSLWSIADKFKISLDTVLWANDLRQNSIIKPDQSLIILPVSGVMHLVGSGDTLSQIAKTYKGDIEEIITFNNFVEGGKIYIGDILVIPDGKMPSSLQLFSVPLASSLFIFPCKGMVSQGLHWYNAIDIANKCGSPIYAAAEGVVQKIGWSGNGGNFIRILHSNGVVTYYGHLSKILVGAGQKVSQGEPMIAYMGETGWATGCHLHFDVRGARNPLVEYSVGTYLSWK